MKLKMVLKGSKQGKVIGASKHNFNRSGPLKTITFNIVGNHSEKFWALLLADRSKSKPSLQLVESS